MITGVCFFVNGGQAGSGCRSARKSPTYQRIKGCFRVCSVRASEVWSVSKRGQPENLSSHLIQHKGGMICLLSRSIPTSLCFVFLVCPGYWIIDIDAFWQAKTRRSNLCSLHDRLTVNYLAATAYYSNRWHYRLWNSHRLTSKIFHWTRGLRMGDRMVAQIRVCFGQW